MASIHRRPKSPNYWAAFMGPDGRRCFRTTGTSDRSAAMRTALEYESAAREGRVGRLTESRVRTVMSDLFTRANREKLPSATVAEFLESWKKRKSIEVSDASMAAYAQTASLLVASLGRKARLPVDSVVISDAIRFRDGLAQRVAPSTVNKLLKIARVIWGDAARDSLTTENPFAKARRLKATPASRRPFTVAELQSLLDAASSDWRGMILCGVYLGQRLGDLARLTWQNIDLAREEATLVTAKTGRVMHIPLAAPLMAYFMERPAPHSPSAPLFPSLADLATTALSNQFSALLASVGLAAKRDHKGGKKGRAVARDTGGLSFHCLRHTMTSLLKNAGISDAIAMELVGHDTAAVSKLYTHISTDAMRQAVNRMPDVTKTEPRK